MSKHKHPSSRRKPRTAHDQDDAFVAGVLDSSEWARKHQQALTLIVIAVGLIFAGLFYYVNFRRTMTIEAVNQLERIHQTIAIAASDDAKAQLSTFLEQFAGTDQANEAVILLGRLHLEAGDAAVAISVLERAALAPAHREPLHDGKLTLISTYDPAAGFNVGHAMQRNK